MRIIGIFSIAIVLIFSCREDFYISTTFEHNALWVANSAENTVTYIDRLTDEVKGTYPVGFYPSRTAVDLDGNCWIGNRNDTTVHFVRRDGTSTKLDGFNGARGVALDKDGNVWIANSGNSTIQKITILDVSGDVSYDISQQVGLTGGVYLYGALVDAEGYLWVADNHGNQIFRYNTQNFPDNSSASLIAIPLGGIYGFTLDTNGKVWVAGYLAAILTKIDAKTATIEKVYNLTGLPNYIGIACDINNKVWIGCDPGNVILKFDPDTELYEIFSIGAESGPHGVAGDDRGYIYTVNFGSNSVCKICSKSGEVKKIYKVGSQPYTYSDLTGFIYRRVTLGLK